MPPFYTYCFTVKPGASGKFVIDQFSRNVLSGYSFHGDSPSGSKEVRANPVSSACEHGNVFLVDGAWNYSFLEELCAFPLDGLFKDQVDAFSGAYNKIQKAGRMVIL